MNIFMRLNQSRTRGIVKNRGAALLIAIIISGVALVVGLGVYNRTYKELIFSSFWRQAQTAFSAADAGLECAMYWDKNQAPSPNCFDGTPLGTWDPTLNLAEAGFSNIPVSGGCVSVVIKKTVVPPLTIIESRGRNSCSASSLRLVERAVGVAY